MENNFALQHQLQEFLYEDKLGAGAHTPNFKKSIARNDNCVSQLVDYVINPRKIKTTRKIIEPN